MPILQANFVIPVTESEKKTTETYASNQASEFNIQVLLTFTKLLKPGFQFGGKLSTCILVMKSYSCLNLSTKLSKPVKTAELISDA